MYVIGLTGSSGAGKTTATKILENHNCYIIDCDKISHEITEPGTSAYFEILGCFDEIILNTDGKINRRALGNIVFNDKEALKCLENITHRAIKEEVYKRLKDAKVRDYDLIVIDAPLLIESGLYKAVDKIWLIYADYETRLKRIAERDGLEKEAVKSRFRSQSEFDELVKYADEIIDTTSLSFEDMEERILLLKESLYA
ncbi:MAG: dephospho-CoA kinase [Clostridiales bacterium]|nr:dephospho-CoA kinase [Clostridiales bacterium]